jgi:hypothetical protein
LNGWFCFLLGYQCVFSLLHFSRFLYIYSSCLLLLFTCFSFVSLAQLRLMCCPSRALSCVPGDTCLWFECVAVMMVCVYGHEPPRTSTFNMLRSADKCHNMSFCALVWSITRAVRKPPSFTIHNDGQSQEEYPRHCVMGSVFAYIASVAHHRLLDAVFLLYT